MLKVAAVPETTKQSILHAFDPLIDLMIDLALSIAGVMITGGALLIMIGQKDKGFSLMMNSALGYCLVNLTLLLLSLLESVERRFNKYKKSILLQTVPINHRTRTYFLVELKRNLDLTRFLLRPRRDSNPRPTV